jgi:hypothetical protein
MKKIYRDRLEFIQCKLRARIFCRLLKKAVFLGFVFALFACYLAILSSAVYAELEWAADGEAICTAQNGQYGPQIVSDGGVGVIETEKSYKDPVVACFLSFFIPGLGQHYNGQYVKGICQEVLFVGGILMWEEAVRREWAYESWEEVQLHAYGLVLAVGTWLWSVIDAPISANNINRERSWGRFSEFNNRNELGLAVAPKKQGIEVSLTLLTLHF